MLINPLKKRFMKISNRFASEGPETPLFPPEPPKSLTLRTSRTLIISVGFVGLVYGSYYSWTNRYVIQEGGNHYFLEVEEKE